MYPPVPASVGAGNIDKQYFWGALMPGIFLVGQDARLVKMNQATPLQET